MSTCQSHHACIDRALDNAETLCRKKGLRLTGLRRKVLELVWASHEPVKAYDVLDRLGSARAPARPPTVYRSLEFLTVNGMVHKLNSLNAYVGCSHPDRHRQCYFLICNRCGEARECCNPDLDRAIQASADFNDFCPSRVTLEIQGECQDCLDNRH